MTPSQTSPRKPLRLWPGIVAVTLQWVGRFVVPAIVPGTSIYGVLSGLLGGVIVVLWWLFFSRAPWLERVGAIVLMIVALFATSRVAHESIATGMMGMMLPIVAIPLLSLALVVWAAATRRLADGPRRAWLAAAILLACGGFTLLRTGGITGDADSDFHWRWTQTPEERLLASAADEPPAIAPVNPVAERAVPDAERIPREPEVAGAPEKLPDAGSDVKSGDLPAAAVSTTNADWPGFRGPQRDSVIRGVRIETDWSRSPPMELWRRPIGPGWSSFAVHGDLIYTQEQRGDEEVVSAYRLMTGEPVWRHRDAARFWESNAGAGPRGTPTIDRGRVYSFGATGILNALDAATGTVMWSHNVAADTGTAIPGWGFASSPLVVADEVIVAAAGTLAAYDAETGKSRWVGPTGGSGYSSPQLVTLDGVTQVLLLNGGGITSVMPADGTVLWEHEWPGISILQPAMTPDGDLLIGAIDSSAIGTGIRRVTVARRDEGWNVEERWTSTGLKPSFNDYVVHDGHAFGFDGSILSCIELESGQRTWKGGRYGHGQLVLLRDQDALLVLSEDGELALVSATPDGFKELARIPAIEGKTWNHPVLAGDILLVRNGEEMAAFRVSRLSR